MYANVTSRDSNVWDTVLLLVLADSIVNKWQDYIYSKFCQWQVCRQVRLFGNVELTTIVLFWNINVKKLFIIIIIIIINLTFTSQTMYSCYLAGKTSYWMYHWIWTCVKQNRLCNSFQVFSYTYSRAYDTYEVFPAQDRRTTAMPLCMSVSTV